MVRLCIIGVCLCSIVGCATHPTRIELRLSFSSESPTNGDYVCRLTEDGLWYCEFSAMGWRSQTIAVNDPGQSFAGIFDDCEHAIAANKKSSRGEHAEFEFRVEYRVGQSMRCATLKGGFWDIDAVFRAIPALKQLHGEITRKVGLPKKYWYYDLPTDTEGNAWTDTK